MKIKPSDLEAQAKQLQAAGKLPSLDKVLQAVADSREKYRDKILAARKQGSDISAGADALKN